MNLSVPSDFPGFETMGDNARRRLKKCGEGVSIYPLAKICRPEVIELGDFCRIGDFVFIWGGLGVHVGRYSDLQPHVTIWGGGETIIGDYVSVAVGTVLLSAVYSHKEGLRMVDHLPEGQTKALYGKVAIENDAYVGANCTIMPNLTVGEGAIIGAHSFVDKDVEPWSICVGSPCRKIGDRPRISVG